MKYGNPEQKEIIEAILFSAGRVVTQEELVLALEIDKKQVEELVKNMQKDFANRGIEIIKIEDGYQLCSKRNIMNTYILF